MRVCIVTASHQNVFFGELLDAFAAGMAERGIDVERAEDHFPAPQEDLVYLFVPHEYVPLTERDSHPTHRQLRRSVALCTEQPGTGWFDEAAGIAADAGAAVDINELGVAELARRGVTARFVPLGYVPAWDHWGGDETSGRQVDLAFMGGYTARRALALARCGEMLQRRRAAIHVFNSIRPHQADDRWFLSGERKWVALRDSKAILNVHRSPLAYMEWQRAIGAICNGCVVVTEHSLGYEPLVPGEHFVSAGFDDLHLAVNALLDNPDRVAAIRQDAYRFLREEMPIAASVDALCTTLEEVRGQRLLSADPGEPAPRPRPLPPPVREPGHLTRTHSDTEVMRGALKHLVLEVRGVKAELAAVRNGTPSPDSAERLGPYDAAMPEVTVVIPLYNHADFVGEAIATVARSDHPAFEVIVVDDASTDDSAEVARDALAAAPWVPARLVRRSRNAGLAAARNLGVGFARGQYVFMLDADNAVYPQALSRLASALDAEPAAAFAYGILESFDVAGPRGLMSWLGWDPFWLRYDNPIDAMAMLRRDAVVAVGGYTSEPTLYGWEDFALWCAFAQTGREGTRVPEIVGRYRVARHSMIATTNIDATSGWATLERRYPAVFSPLSTQQALERA
jgi:hypothetical protein